MVWVNSGGANRKGTPKKIEDIGFVAVCSRSVDSQAVRQTVPAVTERTVGQAVPDGVAQE